MQSVHEAQEGKITACKDDNDGEEDGSPPAKKLKPGDKSTLESTLKALIEIIPL